MNSLSPKQAAVAPIEVREEIDEVRPPKDVDVDADDVISDDGAASFVESLPGYRQYQDERGFQNFGDY